MKYKVAELEGAQLAAAVAKAEGLEIVSMHAEEHPEFGFCKVRDGKDEIPEKYAPQRHAAQGLAIIDREHIATEFHTGDGIWTGAVRSRRVSWEDWEDDGWGEGPAPLIAAMRAYVASKFGEEVELP